MLRQGRGLDLNTRVAWEGVKHMVSLIMEFMQRFLGRCIQGLLVGGWYHWCPRSWVLWCWQGVRSRRW